MLINLILVSTYMKLTSLYTYFYLVVTLFTHIYWSGVAEYEFIFVFFWKL